jgi:DNA repair protein RadC
MLADYEILELLLGYCLPRRDTKPLAKELLDRFGTLRSVLAARPEQLGEINGVGPGLEGYLALLREFWARLHEAPVQERRSLGSPSEVADLAKARLGHLRTEEFWAALVDNKNRLVAWRQVSQGTVDQAPAYPREVLALALQHQASGVILVHNHPGGDPAPSAQDVDLTRRLCRAGQDLGVRVLDHLIVTDSAFFSFQAKGLL